MPAAATVSAACGGGGGGDGGDGADHLAGGDKEIDADCLLLRGGGPRGKKAGNNVGIANCVNL